MKSKTAVPKAKPREPLTKKARAAIHRYAYHHAKKYDYIAHYMIELVIKAERMPRATLYERLEKLGYRWRPNRDTWDMKQ